MPKSGRSGRPRAPVVEYQTYLIKVTAWEPAYTLSLNGLRWRNEPYWEHAALKIKGQCLVPAKLFRMTATATLVADRSHGAMLANATDRKPLCVGSAEVRGEVFDCYSAIPSDAL